MVSLVQDMYDGVKEMIKREKEKKQIEIGNELNEIRGDIFEKLADIVETKD